MDGIPSFFILRAVSLPDEALNPGLVPVIYSSKLPSTVPVDSQEILHEFISLTRKTKHLRLAWEIPGLGFLSL